MNFCNRPSTTMPRLQRHRQGQMPAWLQSCQGAQGEIRFRASNRTCMLNRTHLCFLDCSTLFGHGLGVGSHTLCLWLGSRCLLGLGLGCSRGSSITLILGLSLGLCLWLGRGLLGSSFLGCWLLCLGGCCLLGGLQTTNGMLVQTGVRIESSRTM